MSDDRYSSLDQVRELSVELSTRCNAACPMCSRYRNKWNSDLWDTRKVTENLPLSDLSFDLFKKRFPPKVVKNLTNVIFNGRFGEPLVHPNAAEFVEYIQTCNDECVIEIYTNGSLGNKKFWQSLAKNLGSYGLVYFSVDGLEDTNSYYRQKTSWPKIIESMKTFIDSGGNAFWSFICFEHNEHQVEEAKELAKKMGFTGFEARRTNRFKGNESFRFIDVKGKTQELKVPKNKKYKFEHHDRYLEEKPKVLDIECSFKKTNKLFVSYSGKLWPCSYISDYTPRSISEISMEQKYGSDFNNLNIHTVDEILNAPFFKNDLVNSWNDPSQVLRECWKKCNKNNSNITAITEIEFESE